MNKPVRTIVGVIVAALLTVPLTFTAAAPAASSLPTFSIALTATTVTVTGAPQSGAVNVKVSASGVKEASAILFQLKPGVSVAEVEAFLATKHAGDANAASKYGAIVFDQEAPTSGSSEAQTYLQPGQYLALELAGEGGPKARTPFTVASAPAPAALPAPQATVRSIEFGFRGPSTLRDGELVRFENEGFLVHMNFALPVKNVKVARKVVQLLLAGKEKGLEKLISGPPASFAGPLSTGAYQQETITAAPGVYVEVCFMDTQDGRSHTRLGMERIIRIMR
ncbi:MAG TPA: hypothetical protein VGX69_04130 [Solirubrobacteraceae bacterium]|jgi:hypothetical protein|nr:hypothetical protein [Solirubrobacteraceae bacterium]